MVGVVGMMVGPFVAPAAFGLVACATAPRELPCVGPAWLGSSAVCFDTPEESYCAQKKLVLPIDEWRALCGQFIRSRDTDAGAP